MYHHKHNLRLTAGLLAALGAAPALMGASFVANPSFEKNYNDVFPSYGPIEDWSGGSGVNQANGPFHNGGTPIPDQARVAFMQGGSTLRQTISGLAAGENYWIQFFYDARGCCGGTIDLSTKFADADLDRIPNVRPVTGGKPYEFRNVPFVPQADSGDLMLVSTAAGDATALLDGITIVQRSTNDIVVMNPSFEASGEVVDTGYITGTLAGWTFSGQVGVNINPVGAFANNGVNPDQDSVAFIEGPGAITQLIPNLQAGTEYELSVAVNASLGSQAGLRISVDGNAILDADVSPVGEGDYVVKTVKFTPSSPTAELTLEQTRDGQVLLLDNVRIQGVVIIPLDPIRFSPSAAELAPGQTAQISVSVDPRLLESTAARIVLRIGNRNVATLLGADTDGNLALDFPKGGNPSQSFTVQAGQRGQVRVDVVDAANQKVANDVTVSVVTSYVRNASFEENAAGAFPGYGAIVSWRTEGGAGLNKSDGPFHNGGTLIPDRLQVAFLQGAAKLSQDIFALEAGKNHWLQFAYDARNCCGGTIDLSVRFGGVEISRIEGVIPAEGNAYHVHSVAFTPASHSGTLELVTTAQGDATVTVDAISIVQRGADEVVVINPSFESEGSPSGVGYIQPSRVFGWNATGGYGVNVIGVGPFTDNGVGTEQDRVFLMQGNGSSVAQTINDLSPGEIYTLMVQLNGRNCCGTEATGYQLSVGGEIITEGEMRPVGANNRYKHIRAVFIPVDVSTEIRIRHTSPVGDHTLLLDDVRVYKGDVPAPLPLNPINMQDGTLRIEWPIAESDGMILQSAPSPNGPWTDVPAPPSQEGDSNVVVEPTGTGTLFYRLAR